MLMFIFRCGRVGPQSASAITLLNDIRSSFLTTCRQRCTTRENLEAPPFQYIRDDLPSAFKNCQSESYVDDTGQMQSPNLKDDLLRIRNWCSDNYLLVNLDKTKLMIYGSRQLLSKLPDVRLSLMGEELSPVTVVKYLDVTFDLNLTFYDQSLKTVSPCMSSLAQISRVKTL